MENLRTYDSDEHASHIIERDVTLIRDRIDRFYELDSKFPYRRHTLSGANPLSQARPEVETLRRLIHAKHPEWIDPQGGGFTPGAEATAGHCTEMALAAVDCCLKSPRLAQKIRRLWIAVTHSSHADASHAFVLLSDKELDLVFKRLDVGKLAVHPELNYRLWVIDAWMGVACHASHYEMEATNTLTAWTAEGRSVRDRLVHGPGARGTRHDVDNSQFARALSNGPIELFEVSRPTRGFSNGFPRLVLERCS